MTSITAIILVHNIDDLIRCLTPLHLMVNQIICVNLTNKQEVGNSAYQEKCLLLPGDLKNPLSSLNNALECVSSEWIIFLNSDEVIYQPKLTKLKTLLATTTTHGFSISIHTFTNTYNLSGWKPSHAVAGYTGYTSYDGIRIWKHNNLYRFVDSPYPKIEITDQNRKIEIKRRSLPRFSFHINKSLVTFNNAEDHRKA